MELIDKSAIVAEIERKIEAHKETLKNCDSSISEMVLKGSMSAYQSLLHSLDTLEVKEVDLENSVKGTIEYPFIGYDYPNIYPNYKELKDYCDKNRIMDNDKVKLIIVKEDMS